MSITLVGSNPTGNLRLVCLFVCLFVRSFVLFVLIVLFVMTGVADGHNLSLAGPTKSTNGRVPCGPPIRAAARPTIIAVIAQLVARRSHNPKVVSSILTHRNSMSCITVVSEPLHPQRQSINGLVAEYTIAINVTRARFPAGVSLSRRATTLSNRCRENSANTVRWSTCVSQVQR